MKSSSQILLPTQPKKMIFTSEWMSLSWDATPLQIRVAIACLRLESSNPKKCNPKSSYLEDHPSYEVVNNHGDPLTNGRTPWLINWGYLLDRMILLVFTSILGGVLHIP